MTVILAGLMLRCVCAAETEIIDVPGIVTDFQGNPIAGAEVVLLERGGRPDEVPAESSELARTSSDSSGKFLMKGVKLSQSPAWRLIRATADGYAYGLAGANFAAGAEKRFHDIARQGADDAWIILVPAEKLEGTIVDEEGNPVAGAQVIGDESQEPFTTRADGIFSFEKAPPTRCGVLDGSRSLRVVHPDFAPVELSAEPWYGAGLTPGPQTVKLLRGIKISGQITDRDGGRGLARMSVRATVSWSHSGNFAASTDGEGRYSLRIPPLPPFFIPKGVDRRQRITWFELVATDPNLVEANTIHYRPIKAGRTLEANDATEEFSGIDFQFEQDAAAKAPAAQPPPPKPAATVHGIVRDAGGHPVKLAKLMLRHNEGVPFPAQNAFTDLEGDFDFRRSVVGSARFIWAWSPQLDQAAVIEVPEKYDGTAPLEVWLRPAGEIHGVLHQPSGQPVPNVVVNLVENMKNTSYSLLTTTSDPDGKYTIRGVVEPPEGCNIAVTPRPVADGVTHLNANIAKHRVPGDLSEKQTLNGFDFTIDLSEAFIKVAADAENP